MSRSINLTVLKELKSKLGFCHHDLNKLVANITNLEGEVIGNANRYDIKQISYPNSNISLKDRLYTINHNIRQIEKEMDKETRDIFDHMEYEHPDFPDAWLKD